MLIGVMSDSHDHLINLERAISRLRHEGVAELIHAGDFVSPFAARKLVECWTGPLHVVRGNNDGERRGLTAVLPHLRRGPILLEIAGRRISLDHYPPDERHRPIPDCDLVVFGHTHRALLEERRGSLWLNPGETCPWVTGKPSVATYDTDIHRATIIPLD